MWRSPLVFRLALIALVIAASAEDHAATTVTTRPSRAKNKPKPRKRTTTEEPYEDEDTSTTLDPRTFDHADRGICDIPLGMEGGLINNESLTASSSYDQSVSPLSARIRTEVRGGAWCPNGLISSQSRQYLEIDLQGEYLITATESQGRFANSVGVEFVEHYFVEYWRPSLAEWVVYKDFNGSKLIPGNVNTYTTKKTQLEAPFVASKVRFLPFAAHPRTACMRVEIYGCLWKQSILSYSAPKGGNMIAMAGGSKFEDVSYDGSIFEGVMSGGLGQLTDSLTGPTDFELLDPTDSRGTRWVGWNRSMLIEEKVNLLFNFTTPRQFQYLDLHMNNMFTKDVQLFRDVEIFFSVEGERWQEDTIYYAPKQDRVSEDARTIHIDMSNRTATHIKLILRFQHEWILISEVIFKSTLTTIDYSTEFLDQYYKTESPPLVKKKPQPTTSLVSVEIAFGMLLTIVILIIVTIIVMVRKIGLHNNNRRPPRLALALATCPPLQMLRPAVVDEDYREPYNIWRETLDRREKGDNGNSEQNEYNEICDEPDFPRPYLVKRPDDESESYYAATDIIYHMFPDDRNMRSEKPSPGLFTSIKLPEAEPPNGVAPLLDFPRGRMRPLAFLGEAPYGTLQICETSGLEELLEEETYPGPRRRLVVIKTLWRGCHNDVKSAFVREATWGAGLKHPQLARVLGLSLQEPPCAALDRGDATSLPTILRHPKKLNYASLIHLCCQIAAGMKYLESFELVHRDLAARNVTVTDDLTVKISDYAMFTEEYVGDYHLMTDGSRMPLRWMSWETILQNMYSPSSDVWSFGVTVWEILNYCSAKPYDDMTDEQVVDNATEWRNGGPKATVPSSPPPRCRRELYDIMHECWRREPSQRPRFLDLHRYLNRLTEGFTPPPVR